MTVRPSHDHVVVRRVGPRRRRKESDIMGVVERAAMSQKAA
jgi:hypothetical protein